MMNSAQPQSAPPRLHLSDGAAIAALAVITVAFFWRMAFTNLILPRGDMFLYFYPYWAYRNAVMQTGHLPLWNPYLFMGAPLLANSQVGVLYPPNWLLIGLDAPTAVKVAIITHTVWAAAGMLLFARRSLRLSTLASILTAAAFALGGYLSAQVEHVNQLQGLAWMPWLFWLWSEAIISRQHKAVLWLGAAFAMQLLAGHSQTAFISGTGLGVWALWFTLALNRSHPDKAPESRRWLPVDHRVLWPVGMVGLAAILALGLAAAQVLPTLELTSLSNRGGGLPILEALSFSLRPQIIGRALLPSYAPTPLFSEYVAYLGVAGLVLAILGLWHRRHKWSVLGLGVLAALGLFLALGAYNPVYWLLVKFMPGFNLFRAPARWLALYTFSMAALAGIGLDSLTLHSEPLEKPHPWSLALPAVIVTALTGLSFLAPLSAEDIPGGVTRPSMVEVALWTGTMLLALSTCALLRRGSPFAQRFGRPALVALVIIELFVASRRLPYNDLSAPEAWSSQRPAISTLLAAAQEQPPPRLLSLSDTLFDPGDLREIETVYRPYLSEKAIYDYIVATKHKEILAPNLSMVWGIPSMDGFDGGILPTREYTHFTGLFLPPDTWNPDGRLRENLDRVPDLAWLRMANVGFIITDKVRDAWIEGVYYDLQFPASRSVPPDLSSPPPIQAFPVQPFQATTVGIVGYIENAAAVPDGAQIGSVAVFYEGGEFPLVQPLLVGRDFTAGTPDSRQRALIRWNSPVPMEHIEVSVVTTFPGTLVVQGISLIDERSSAFATTTISDDGTLRLINSGDVKVYAYDGALPRAYLVCGPQSVSSAATAYEQLASDPTTQVIVSDARGTSDTITCRPDAPGQAIITAYEAERVNVWVNAQGEGLYLFLSDAWYPGWEATVDGQPAPIAQANGLFRAVRMPAGEHEVVFTYRCRLFTVGAVISGVCLLAVATGTAIKWPQRRH